MPVHGNDLLREHELRIFHVCFNAHPGFDYLVSRKRGNMVFVLTVNLGYYATSLFLQDTLNGVDAYLFG